MGAINAMPALLKEYYNNSSEEFLKKQGDLVQKYISELSSSNQVSRMGHSLALGTFPAFMLGPHLTHIIDALIMTTKITHDTLKWAESRRDAIKSLTTICVTMEECIGKG